MPRKTYALRFDSERHTHLACDVLHLQVLVAVECVQCARLEHVANTFGITVLAPESSTAVENLFRMVMMIEDDENHELEMVYTYHRFAEGHKFHIDIVLERFIVGVQLVGDESGAVRAQRLVVNGNFQLLIGFVVLYQYIRHTH